MSTNELFGREERAIANATEWLASEVPANTEKGREAFETLLEEYRNLFKTTRRLMRVSDRNEQELRRLSNAAENAKATLSRYFSPNLARELVEDPEFLGLSGERREMTFLFTDLADFSALAEDLEPSIIVPLLNEYLDSMTQIVYRHGGTTDKIVGDALNVIFGAPEEQPDQAERSLACALEIDAFSESFRAQKSAENISLGVTRIGIHSGPAIVGNFGGKIFYNYTAYGDTVNTAARLESVNKHLGTRICASETTVAKAPGLSCRPVGSLVLKGKTQELKVFEPLSAEQSKEPSIDAYRAAFEKLELNNADAKKDFAAIVAHHGEDPLAIFHLVRLLDGESGVRIIFGEK